MLNTHSLGQQSQDHYHSQYKNDGDMKNPPLDKADGASPVGDNLDRPNNPYLPYQISLAAGVSNEHEKTRQQQFRARLTGRAQSLSHLWRQTSHSLTARNNKTDSKSSEFISFDQGLLDHPLVHAQSGLHEINPGHYRDIATALELALALSTTRPEAEKTLPKPILLCLLDEMNNDTSLFAPLALQKYGLRPQDLILVRATNSRDLIWAMEEGIFSGAVSCVIGHAHLVSQSISQRLNHISLSQQVPALLITHHPEQGALQANWRWRISQVTEKSAENDTAMTTSLNLAAEKKKSSQQPLSHSIVSQPWQFSLIRKGAAQSADHLVKYEGKLSWRKDLNALQLSFIQQEREPFRSSSPHPSTSKENVCLPSVKKMSVPTRQCGNVSLTVADLH